MGVITLKTGCQFLAVICLLWTSGLWANTGEVAIEKHGYIESQIDLFLHLNRLLSATPNFWNNITELGDALVYFAFLTVLFSKQPKLWAALLSAVPLTGILSSAGKSIFAMPRPAAVLPHQQFEIVGKALTGYTSLPSGHTMTAFSITTVVVIYFAGISRSKSYSFCIFLLGIALAVLVGVSRVAVGAHWPLDVVAGALLGIAGGISGILIMRLFSNWWQWIHKTSALLGFGVLFILISIAVVSNTWAKGDSNLVLPWLAAAFALITGIQLIAKQIKSMFFEKSSESKD